MSLFEGTPVYIELTDEKKIFEIITADRGYNDYDIDWCDDHGHYHAHQSGGTYSPYHALTHRVDEHGAKVHTYYWAASQFEVQYQDGADLAYCIKLDAPQIASLFLSEQDILNEFLHLHEIPTLEDMSDLFIPNLVSYWEQSQFVEEGEVVYCPICQKHYNYEQNYPCDHVRWCETCGFFSIPYDECPHRSADSTCYEA